MYSNSAVFNLANYLDSLHKRLESGDTVLCAEGYALGLARRGYTGAGLWTPQFMLEYPEVLTGMHYEFVHCGSDVVQALQVGKCTRFDGDLVTKSAGRAGDQRVQS